MTYLKHSIIAGLMAVSTAFIALANAAPSINLETQVPGGELFSAPTHIVARIYETPSSGRAVTEQVLLEGEWQSDMEPGSELPPDAVVRFSMVLEQTDWMEAGETLWAEISLDGRIVGDRTAFIVPEAPKFTIEGEIETRGQTGGIRFPDDSFQDSASPLISGSSASVPLDMGGNRISNLQAPAASGDAVPLSYLQTYVADNGDNLGNHTSTTNIRLNGYRISNDGDDEGIRINDEGHVGINTYNPSASLQVGGNGVVFEGWGETIPKEGQGGRMMWLPSKMAFRAGVVLGSEWNNDVILSGTLNTVAGLDVVTGNGTAFTQELNVGDLVVFGDLQDNYHGESTVKSIESDNQLTLNYPHGWDYSGAAILVHVGSQSVAMGAYTVASGRAAFSVGYATRASEHAAVALGRLTTASGYTSTALGLLTTASGHAATAMGRETTASKDMATAMGYRTVASGRAATAMGEETSASHDAQTVVGKYNLDSGFDSSSGDPLFVVGNGTDDLNRSNALVITSLGNAGIGEQAPENRMHVADNIAASQNDNDTSEYVTLVQNRISADRSNGLAIQMGKTNPGDGVNFIGFFDGNGNLIGEIDGNGSGSVNFKTSGADYAEYLPQLDANEGMKPSDIVGVSAGHISLNTSNAEQVMVITDRAAILGNAPYAEEKTMAHQAVSFIGQVPVRVSGQVRAGDLILASGKNDGTGIAVSIDALGRADQARIVGRAWESSDEPGLKKVMVAVGLDQTDISMAHVTRLQTALDLQQQEIMAQRARIAELETMSAEIVALRAELTEYRMLVQEIQSLEGSLVQRH